MKTKKITFKRSAFLCGLILTASIAGGCTSETIAGGLTTKNISGNGTVIDSHIGVDTDTKIPELETIFISGDFATVKAGTNAVTYREESSASVWNASSITKKRFLCITLTDQSSIPATLSALSKIITNGKTASE